MFEFKTKPFKHQTEAFKRFKDEEQAALFWEMGLGKTKTLIDLVRYQFMTGGEGKVLILCPKNVVKVWPEEFAIHSDMADLVEILTGTRDARINLLENSDKLIFITNYDILRTPKKIFDANEKLCVKKDPLTERLLKINWKICIADESHRIKNHKSQRGKILAQLGMRSEIRYAASGTPQLRSLMDYFNQFKFLDRGKTFGRVFSEFKYTYWVDANQALRNQPGYYPLWVNTKEELDKLLEAKIAEAQNCKHDWAVKNAEARAKAHYDIMLELVKPKHEALGRGLSVIADRKTKKECFDIEDPIFKKYYCEPTASQQKAYTEMLENLVHYITDLKEKGQTPAIVAQNALVKSLRLLQISSGFMHTDLKKTAYFTDNPKLKLAEEVIEDIGEDKIAICGVFHEDIDLLKEKFKHLNPAEIHGRADNEKGKLKFIEDKTCKLLIAHPGALIGQNGLTVCSNIIFFSNNNKFEDRDQSIGRFHARGKIRNIATVHDLICLPIDELAINAHKRKQNMAEMVLKYCQTGGILKNK